MTKNDLRVGDRFTFSLTGIPVASSYASLPVISNDRIRKTMRAKPESSPNAPGAESDTPTSSDAVER